MTPKRAPRQATARSIRSREHEKSPGARSPAALGVVVAIVTFLAFSPALRNGFVTWDDDRNFLQNPMFRGLGLAQLKWMWTTTLLGHYVPLSWMTLGLDYTVWGMDPFGYHLTNILLHAATATTLYFIALRLLRAGFGDSRDDHTLQLGACLAALLYALHPLRVESVAWITERRDVLSQLLLSLSTIQYLRAVDGTAVARKRLAGSVTLFALSLLAKASGVMLPIALLVLDVYPLRRITLDGAERNASWRRALIEKAPYLALSLIAGIASVIALPHRVQLSAISKLAVTAYGLSFYVTKTLIPLGLRPVYPMPAHIAPSELRYVTGLVVVVAITLYAWLQRRQWPALLTGWTCFVVLTVPLLGIVQNGPQIVADRYTYIGGPALACAAAALVLLRPRFLPAALIATIVVYGSLTWRQIGVWHDSERFWSYELQYEPAVSVAHSSLADELAARGLLDSAVTEYQLAVRYDSIAAHAENNLAVALIRLGRPGGALPHLRRAIALDSTYADAYLNLGSVLSGQDSLAAAESAYARALAIAPWYGPAEFNWGNAMMRHGKPEQAIAHYRRAVALSPNEPAFLAALAAAETGLREHASRDSIEAHRPQL